MLNSVEIVSLSNLHSTHYKYLTVAIWHNSEPLAFHEPDHTKLSNGKQVLAKGS